ncbi:hypothetical protein AcW1_006437 [Taiwanofungus camphoratus]|nr:hypothetical protein AcV5_009021 [Antrodia cinnamomea]KAI0924270.1 hypothetical protein AcW2_005198 [Antrodia cinnamomea]KAI0954593.1 hypothetical protein AcW1_006437 [Antrodia cinnamomea]
MVIIDTSDPTDFIEKGRSRFSKPLPESPQFEQGSSTDEPPPYQPRNPQISPPVLPTARSNSVFQPAITQRVNHVLLRSEHNSISGTYLIDPCLPFSPVAAGMSGKSECRDRSLERRHVRNTQRAFGSVPGIDGSTGWCRGRKEIPELHGAFRTRNAAISLDVGIAEPETEQAAQVGGKVTGRIMASSLHGRVSVNLFVVHPGRCVDLDISTRHGNITVLLPPTFHGVIAISTRQGQSGMTFLPAFAGRAQVVRGSDRETLIFLSPSAVGSGSNDGQGQDYCVVGTRHGKIMIGLSGVDQVPASIEGGGLFKKLGDLVQLGAKEIGVRVQSTVQARMQVLEATLARPRQLL